MVADKGLSEGVMAEMERALSDHELIKVRLEHPKSSVANGKQSRTDRAQVVQSIGQILLLYRKTRTPTLRNLIYSSFSEYCLFVQFNGLRSFAEKEKTMLTQLAINNLAIVHSQTLELSPGLTVLTGETGAGKSLLLDGLGLILGERADSSLVTDGRSRAEVSASFDLTQLPEAQHWLQQLELEDPDHPSELHVRRTLTHDGRSKAYINGRPITLNDLKALAQQLVSLQGQHAQYAMLNPIEQLRILDQYAGLDGLKNETRRLWTEFQKLVKRRDQLINTLDSADSGRELLRYQVSELQEAHLEASEVSELEEQLKHLSGAQEYKQSLDQAHHALTADQGGAVDAVQQALHRIGSIDLNTQDIENMLNEALINLNESAQQLSQQQDQIDDDPESLTRVESRLNTLHQLARNIELNPSSCINTAWIWSAS